MNLSAQTEFGMPLLYLRCKKGWLWRMLTYRKVYSTHPRSGK